MECITEPESLRYSDLLLDLKSKFKDFVIIIHTDVRKFERYMLHLNSTVSVRRTYSGLIKYAASLDVETFQDICGVVWSCFCAGHIFAFSTHLVELPNVFLVSSHPCSHHLICCEEKQRNYLESGSSVILNVYGKLWILFVKNSVKTPTHFYSIRVQ